MTVRFFMRGRLTESVNLRKIMTFLTIYVNFVYNSIQRVFRTCKILGYKFIPDQRYYSSW